jgi:hypothetical protein
MLQYIPFSCMLIYLVFCFLDLQVVSPFPPSDKIGVNSVQREAEEIIPMKQMKMDWVPYIPLENRYGLLFIAGFLNLSHGTFLWASSAISVQLF